MVRRGLYPSHPSITSWRRRKSPQTINLTGGDLPVCENVPEYSNNYYVQTISVHTPYPRLTQTEEADVCVIGAGLAGLTAALTLARAGKRVVLLEAEKVAWGASGRNGGVVSPGYSTSFAKIAKRAGLDGAKQLHLLSMEGVDIVRKNIASLDIQDANPIDGTLKVSRYENSAEAKENIQWLEKTFNYRLEYKSKEEIRSLLASDKYMNGVLNPHAFHFHPLNYALGLAKELERLGGKVFEDSRALKISKAGATRHIKTAQGTVKAPEVLVTCGGYTDDLVPRLARSYIPISTYMVVTERAKDLIGTAIKSSSSIGDTRRSSDYYRLVDDGERILWGGMITTKQAEPTRLGALLKQRMVDTYPQLADIRIERSWSGKMAYAKHLMPQIGKLDDGLWYCMSFGGHGMNTTAIGGTVIAEAILGQSNRYTLFSPFGLEWNGSVAGTAAVQLTYWYYQLCDFLQERKSQRLH
ncbi:gamma-glutamylputrescine oxidase [Paralcaligenes ureilyticus]|uniref:Gamma-glutamylputrescine oxidase n=1 Tax=Paralcaligenes ureilyticus TaxID=627131 RepID=A0A4R3MA71_9BURK|nr:gamma-glutamylputrescine oxidase [Paralcaligenes ureilyticus]